MPTYLQLYEDDDTTPFATPLDTGDVDGGTVFTAALHVWNDKGAVFGDAVTAHGALISIKYDNGTSEQIAGTPPLDEFWFGIRAIGMDNTADPDMPSQTTGVQRIGAGASFQLEPISVDCARFLEVSIAPPPGASNTGYNLVLEITVGNSSVVLPVRLGTVSGGGIIPDWMNGSARRLTRGRTLSAGGTDVVVAANGSWAYDGALITQTKESLTLNQTAADGALAVGQKYFARLSQPVTGAITVTKGNKGVSPDTPDLPADEIDLGVVEVLYQGGGTSIINTANLDVTDVLYGEYLVTDGGSLNARVGIGNAISNTDSGPFADNSVLVALTDNATNTVWLKPDGSFIANTTDARPITGAERLAYVTTLAGVVTSIVDARTFVGHALYDYVVELKKLGAFSATAADIAWEPAPFDAAIMRIALEIGKKGTSTSGSFKANVTTRPAGTDLGTAGTTVFTSSGSDDQRPSVAFGATILRAESVGHEVTTVTKGQRVAADIAAIPGGISVNPEDFIVLVFLRRLN